VFIRVDLVKAIQLLGFLRQVERSLDAALHLDWSDVFAFFEGKRGQDLAEIIKTLEGTNPDEGGRHGLDGSRIEWLAMWRAMAVLFGLERALGSQRIFVLKGLISASLCVLRDARRVFSETDKPGNDELITIRIAAYNCGFELGLLFAGSQFLSNTQLIEHVGCIDGAGCLTVDEWVNSGFAK
jgi:hypothetical protein